jgi:gas vesicle protein
VAERKTNPGQSASPISDDVGRDLIHVIQSSVSRYPLSGLEWSNRIAAACYKYVDSAISERNSEGIMKIGRYESSEDSNVGTAITFLLIGLGAGALLGLLLAPKTGKQLRRDLRRGYEDARDSLGEWADEAKDHVREAGDRLRDVANRGVEIAEDLRDKVEPLRRAINRG